MSTVQIATRVDETQSQLFRETTKRLGTTPADALRMFVAAFNEHRGFPYDVRLDDEKNIVAFESEDEATGFASRLSKRMLDETR
ncbi:MAG: type II toxin-antitoxin system RelB/DinJ family antitoxin [Acidobacteriota bacterium]|jgi:DNA-damage-inducible protein J|nr:type II toxin-antitoxin system RelB/DinJ family antitoxin [Acidobacteriota bacterium]